MNIITIFDCKIVSINERNIKINFRLKIILNIDKIFGTNDAEVKSSMQIK